MAEQFIEAGVCDRRILGFLAGFFCFSYKTDLFVFSGGIFKVTGHLKLFGACFVNGGFVSPVLCKVLTYCALQVWLFEFGAEEFAGAKIKEDAC